MGEAWTPWVALPPVRSGEAVRRLGAEANVTVRPLDLALSSPIDVSSLSSSKAWGLWLEEAVATVVSCRCWESGDPTSSATPNFVIEQYRGDTERVLLLLCVSEESVDFGMIGVTRRATCSAPSPFFFGEGDRDEFKDVGDAAVAPLFVIGVSDALELDEDEWDLTKARILVVVAGE